VVRDGDSLPRLLPDARAQVDAEWAAFLGMIDALPWQGAGTLAMADDTAAGLIGSARVHRERVGATIEPERLLVWGGWRPLCRFLELPEPDVELPHIYDRAEFLGRITGGSIEALQAWRTAQIRADRRAPR
jgi:hypothetical protein